MFQRNRISTLVLVVTVLLQVTPTAGQAIWEILLAPFLTLAAKRTCDSVQSIFAGDSPAFDCECDASFTLANGIETEIACGQENAICLLDETFCGTTTFGASYGVRTGLGSGLACLEIESGFPSFPELEALVNIPELCIEGTVGGLLRFDSCEVTLGGAACSECSVCSSGLDVTFDCSNVNASPVPAVNIPGPVVTQCVGIGLVPGLGARANSVQPFGERV